VVSSKLGVIAAPVEPLHEASNASAVWATEHPTRAEPNNSKPPAKLDLEHASSNPKAHSGQYLERTASQSRASSPAPESSLELGYDGTTEAQAGECRSVVPGAERGAFATVNSPL
jgi:hypothetical protein